MAARPGVDAGAAAVDLAGPGHRVLRTSHVKVITSARHHYRAPDGFGRLLSTLGG